MSSEESTRKDETTTMNEWSFRVNKKMGKCLSVRFYIQKENNNNHIDNDNHSKNHYYWKHPIYHYNNTDKTWQISTNTPSDFCFISIHWFWHRRCCCCCFHTFWVILSALPPIFWAYVAGPSTANQALQSSALIKYSIEAISAENVCCYRSGVYCLLNVMLSTLGHFFYFLSLFVYLYQFIMDYKIDGQTDRKHAVVMLTHGNTWVFTYY